MTSKTRAVTKICPCVELTDILNTRRKIPHCPVNEKNFSVQLLEANNLVKMIFRL